jgi:hypothetical protein
MESGISGMVAGKPLMYRFWLHFARHVFMFALAGLVFTVLSVIYRQAIPVVAFMHADQWQISQGHVSAHVEGYKLRRCTRIAGSEVGYVRTNGQAWIETRFAYLADETPDNSKPRGWYSFGRWQWSDQGAPPSHVMMTIKHDCSGKISSTTIGPFRVR